MGSYEKNSLSLYDTVALGTGVMIGAGIFALLGQIAELSGAWFPVIFLIGAIISSFSAYSYIKMSNTFPSAGGIAMYLMKAYGKSTTTAGAALLMAFSMIINESLVARTFGTYTLQLFDLTDTSLLVPALGVGLLVVAFVVNISGNEVIGKSSIIMAIIKIGGVSVFALGGLWAADFSIQEAVPESNSDYTAMNYLGAIALSILAFKGFTTITNSGEEIKDPHKNVGRAIILAIIICLVVYLAVAIAVSINLSVPEIVEARDYALAEAARPAFGKYGVWFTVAIAVIATVSGIIASVFAVSRMTAMLTNMQLIPHSHLGMSGRVQKHMLVYIVGFAILLTAFFDLSRIASLGAVFYLVMDIIIHWGVFRKLRKEVKANPIILLTAIVLDTVVLFAFLWTKWSSDRLVVIVSLALMVLIFALEHLFLKKYPELAVDPDEDN